MTRSAYIPRSPSSAQTVAKQRLKTHLKRIRNREYLRLRDMVPAIAKKDKITKLTVIEEAVRYIDELHRALASRLINTELKVTDKNVDVLQTIMHSFIPADFMERRAHAPTTIVEKQQKLPAHLAQTAVKKPTRFS